jgi:hypothetical protein
MRRPPRSVLVLALVLVGAVGACSDDASSTSSSTSTTVALADLGLVPADLPAGFTASADVDDTLTAFCANEDATAGLQASDREVHGFTRTAGGASVIQLVFRFKGDDATAFVAQAGAILERCSGVPDLTGLAFEYGAISPGLDDALAAATDTHVAKHGLSVGSGNLSLDLVVLQKGDVGQLVAVLGLDLPRSDLDALAAATFDAVAAKL